MLGNSFYKLHPERRPGHKTKVQYAERTIPAHFQPGCQRLPIRQLAQSNEANNNSAISAWAADAEPRCIVA
jgi:hypothetical protein